jgi:hypothetical protein
VAELRGSGGTDCLSASRAKEQPKIWNNDCAAAVAVHCIQAMMQGNPHRMEWQGDYLRLKSETSLEIPRRFLEQAFLRQNIVDEKALSTGMRLYRLGGAHGVAGGSPKGEPVLVLAPQKPHTTLQAQAASARSSTPAPVVHKTQSKTGFLESVLRCLSPTMQNEQPPQACPQSGPSWHPVFAQKDTEGEEFEDIPETLLSPVRDLLDPANCCGISSITPLFEYVVSSLGISHLFGNSKQDVVITLGSSRSKSLNFEQAIKQCGKHNIDTARVLAVSILCSDFKMDDDALELDHIGESECIRYDLGAFIVFKQGKYTSYVKKSSNYYEINGQKTNRKQWKTAKRELALVHAFLLYYQDRASLPSAAANQVGRHGAPLLSRHSRAIGPEPSALSGPQPLLSPCASVSAKAASVPAKKDQIKLSAEVLDRIQVSSSDHHDGGGGGQIKIAINLPYDAELDFEVRDFRYDQMNHSTPMQVCHRPRTVLIPTITRSLALLTSPEYEKVKTDSGWVFIDELSESLRASTGFTHSLQSLDLDHDSIRHVFRRTVAKPPFNLDETRILQYIASKGMVLMEAVKHHNKFFALNHSQFQALQISSDTTESFYSKQLRGVKKEEFKQATCAYLLHGMLAGIKTMQHLVIYLPVSADERQSILQVLCAI